MVCWTGGSAACGCWCWWPIGTVDLGNWNAIKSLYESIVDEIELGNHDWTDDFSGYETMVPLPQHSAVTSTGGNKTLAATRGDDKKSDDRKKSSSFEVYWCKDFQQGKCDSQVPHMAQLKNDEPPVPVLHICAACWMQTKKRKDHAEQDATCPLKK